MQSVSTPWHAIAHRCAVAAYVDKSKQISAQGEILKQPCLVGNSLPQGDCWSMLAMRMVLLPIGNRIERQFPATIHLCR
jgi:hypothetical protein